MSGSSGQERIDSIVEEFVERLRGGESVSIDLYCDRYPELADALRELLPIVAALEEGGQPLTASRRQGHSLPHEPSSGLDFPGTRLGQYRILRKIAQGGMGTVYLAVQSELGRPVALKIMARRDEFDAVMAARFHREAQLLASLSHPHIVPIYDFGECDGWYYLAMQWVDGVGLDQLIERLREVPASLRSQAVVEEMLHTGGGDAPDQSAPACGSLALPPVVPPREPNPAVFRKSTIQEGTGKGGYFAWVARIGATVADALDFAHMNNVLHRDIKPSNILIDRRGTVWVADLGLAKRPDESLTHTGDIVGTPRYMAPERFRGWCDPRSDIYSLGLTLYELLTLRPTFSGTDVVQLVRDICHREPVRPRKIEPAIPKDLETIVMKAISKEPAERYETAGHMRDDLERYLSNQPITARRTSTLRRVYLWSHRNPLVAALAACIVFLIIGGGILSFAAAMHFQRSAHKLAKALAEKQAALQDARRAKRTAEGALRKLKVANRAAEERLYQMHLAQAKASRWSRQVGRHVQSLAGLRAAALLMPRLGKTSRDKLELRNAAIASMGLVDLRPVRTWSAGFPRWFDRTLQYGVWEHGNDELVIGRVKAGQELLRIPRRSGVLREGRFSASGEWCAICYQGSPSLVEVWNVKQAHSRHKLNIVYRYATRPFDFHPTDEVLALLRSPEQLELIDLATGKARLSLRVGPHANHVRFAPDGSKVAIATMDAANRTTVQLWDLERRTKTAELVPDNPRQWVHAVAWSRNGRWVAVGTEGGSNAISVWEVQKHRAIELTGHTNAVVYLAFTPDDRLLVSRSWDQTGRVWGTASWSELLRFEAGDAFLARDGEKLAVTYSNRIGSGAVFELVRPDGLMTLPEENAPLTSFEGLFFTLHPSGIRITSELDRGILGTIPVRKPNGLLVCPASRGLMTASEEGILWWPLSRDKGSLQIGPPLELAPHRPPSNRMMGQASFAASADGKVVAYSFGDGRTVCVRHREKPGQVLRLQHRGKDHHMAVSPNGRWTVTGAWLGAGLRVWDNQSGALVRDLAPHFRSALARFSPGGQWLAVWAMDQYELWRVDDEPVNWHRVKVFTPPSKSPVPGRLALSPNGRLLALGMGFNSLDLVDLDRGETVATLPGVPGIGLAGPVDFSPDGRYLFGHREGICQVWDLELIQRRLDQLGLGWSIDAGGPAAHDRKGHQGQVDERRSMRDTKVVVRVEPGR